LRKPNKNAHKKKKITKCLIEIRFLYLILHVVWGLLAPAETSFRE
jgi:hypothetical protein